MPKHKKPPGRPAQRAWRFKPGQAPLRYANRVKQATKAKRHTRHIFEKTDSCCRKTDLGDKPRCRTFFCAYCGHIEREAEIGGVANLFGSRPPEHVFLATVLFDLRPEILHRVEEPRDVLDSIFGGAVRNPHDRPLDFGPLLKRKGHYSSRISRALIKKDGQPITDACLVHGSHEWVVSDFLDEGRHPDEFAIDFNAAEGLPPPKIGDRRFCHHAHFLVCAQRGGAYLSPDEIGALLRAEFPHRRQVHLERLYCVTLKKGRDGKTQTFDESLAACVGYAAKSFIRDANDDEIRELALLHDGLTNRSRRICRATGTFARPSKAARKRQLKKIRTAGAPADK